jgi:hypothetical protein
LFLKRSTIGESSEGIGECQSKELLFENLSIGNVGPDGDVFVRFTINANDRDDGRVHPVDRTVLGPILNLAMPHLPIRDGVIHLLEKTPLNGGRS